MKKRRIAREVGLSDEIIEKICLICDVDRESLEGFCHRMVFGQIVFWTSDHTVYATGFQLRDDVEEIPFHFHRIEVFTGYPMKVMDCTAFAIAGLSEDGEVFVHGNFLNTNFDELKKLEFGNNNLRDELCRGEMGEEGCDKIIDMKCGLDFIVLRTMNGRILAAGCNTRGQIGLGRDSPEWISKITYVCTIRDIDYMLCGKYHTIVTVKNYSDVFCWGGCGDYFTCILSPQRLSLLCQRKKKRKLNVK